MIIWIPLILKRPKFMIIWIPLILKRPKFMIIWIPLILKRPKFMIILMDSTAAGIIIIKAATYESMTEHYLNLSIIIEQLRKLHNG